jgi:hypothetical protein
VARALRGRTVERVVRVRVCVAVVFAVTCALAGLWTPAARSHGERDPALRTIIDAVPRVPGLDVRVAPGVAQRLEVRNTSGQMLEILAASGEPFLRIGPRGVEANLASRGWYASGNADGVVRAPPDAGPRTTPRWRLVSRQPRWGWFAHELHPNASGNVPGDVVRAGRPARLGGWKVTVTVDGQRRDVEGHFEYRPVRGNLSVRLTTAPEVAPGVSVAVLQGRVPGLFLTSRTRRTVLVEGVDGHPFARLGRDGAELNVAGETYRQQPDAPAGTPAATSGSGNSVTRWRRVSEQPSLSWIEPRAAYERDEPPAEILARKDPTVLKRWSVRLRVGGRPAAVSGQTLWVPLAVTTNGGPGGGPAATTSGSGGSRTAAFVGALALACALAGAMVLRRRRDRGRREAEPPRSS